MAIIFQILVIFKMLLFQRTLEQMVVSLLLLYIKTCSNMNTNKTNLDGKSTIK